jgi:Fe-S cluster assembly iron-binding protein IscA
MLDVTDGAKQHLVQLMSDNEVPDEGAVRIVVHEDALTLAADEPRPGDATFDLEGRTVLVMEQAIADHLDGKTLDVEATEEGTELKLA